MKKFCVFLLIITLCSSFNFAQSKKAISILGDSYSTFEGYLQPDTNSIWLGWFGVLNEFRRKGYGQQILIDTINMAKYLAKKYPIKYFRLYTSEKDDSITPPLYYKIMDIKEYYNNVNDVNYDNTCVIFSKSLFETPITYWNDRFLNLKEIIAAQKLGNNEMLNK